MQNFEESTVQHFACIFVVTFKVKARDFNKAFNGCSDILLKILGENTTYFKSCLLKIIRPTAKTTYTSHSPIGLKFFPRLRLLKPP